MAKALSGDSYGLDYQGGDGWGPSYAPPSPSGSSFNTTGMTTPTLPTTPTTPTKAPAATPQQGYSEMGASFTTPTTGSGMDTGPATDPVEQDRVARQTYTDLKNAGHDVKWVGNQLMVDGRAYELGNPTTDPTPDAAPAPSPAASSSTPPPSYIPGVPNTDFGGGMSDQQNRQIGDTFGTAAPPGFDAAKWADQTHLTDKYLIGHILAASGSPSDAVAALNQQDGAGTWTYVGGDTIRYKDGSEYDIAYDYGGPDQRPQMLQTKGPGGVPIASGGGAGGSGVSGLAASYLQGQGGTAINPDLPNFSWEQLLAQLQNDPSATGLDSLVRDIQAHPTSLDDHAVGTMKAQMKDTLAEQQQFEDQNLQGLGAANGISDSPWLASERLASDRSKNQAIASGSANIDIQAAQTRAADQRAAAGVGINYQQMRGSRLVNAVQLALQKAGIKLDYARLSQQDEQFLRDLGYRLAALEQNDAQFGADLDYRNRSLQQNDDQFAATHPV